MGVGVRGLFAGPIPGSVILLGGILWDAVSDGFGPTLLVAAGALYAVMASEIRIWRLRRSLAPKLALVLSEEFEEMFVREKPTERTIHGTTPPVVVPSGGMSIHGVGIVNRGHEQGQSVRVR